MDELDQYVFVIHMQISEFVDFIQSSAHNNGIADKDTNELTFYIDVKSEGLRNILREIMQNIKKVSLRENKPSVLLLFCVI